MNAALLIRSLMTQKHSDKYFLLGRRKEGGFKNHDIRDVVCDKETQTLVTFMRDSEGRHTFTGRIIIKRTKPGDVKEM